MEKYRNIAATEKSKYQKVSENIGNGKSKALNAHFLHHASENSKRKTLLDSYTTELYQILCTLSTGT